MNMISYIPVLTHGVMMTLISWITAGALSILLGTVIGIISCQHLVSKPLAVAIKGYTFIAKGVPAYVQILIAYFVIPSVLHVAIPGFFAATMALAFCSSGYVTEIVRSGMNAISRGQWDAAFALGYPLRATLSRIIMPQALRHTLPALIGELEQLLKSTSLLATIGVTELTRTGMNIISRELNPIPVYLTIAVLYLLFSALLQIFMFYWEKRSHGYY
jgi:His/Glu/Gln/Arg/opine family amino acid ABC transporter permease subunit